MTSGQSSPSGAPESGPLSDKPILFSGEMVRAILDGRKTQTRRVVKVPRYATYDGHPVTLQEADGSRMGEALMVARRDGDGSYLASSPYGWVVGRLWVRETWASLSFDYDHESGYCDGWEPCAPELARSCVGEEWRQHSAHRPYGVVYAADDGWDSHMDDRGFAWRPSIHMPRWACRLVLEITDVRVERLQAISEADAEAEGVEPLLVPPDGGSCPHIEGYRELWDSLNAKRGFGWESNPFVWVISFKRIDASRVEPAPAVDFSRSSPDEASLTLASLVPSTGAETAE